MVKLIILQSTSNISDSTTNYQYKDIVMTVNTTDVDREYYPKNSEACNNTILKMAQKNKLLCI